MVKRIAPLTLFLGILAAPAAAQEKVATIAGLELHSAFWPNLHHRLHADAADQKGRVSAAALPAADRAAWEAAIAFYAADLAKRDLRRGRDMSGITDALSREGALGSEAVLSAEHRAVLERVAPVYRRHRWPEDDKANRAWIADVTARLKGVGPKVLPKLAAFYQLPWYEDRDPIRVDIVHVGNARGGYTWTRPRVHSVLDSADATYGGWLGVEMLLHEASHGLTDRLAEAIEKEAAAAGKKDDGTLWHVAQFFVVGEVLKRTLAADCIEFTPYMYETGLFDRAWKQFKPAIETHLRGYLDGKHSLPEALKLGVTQS